MLQGGIGTTGIVLFTLMLIRVSAMMLIAPIFSAQNVPNMVKLGLSVLLVVALYPIEAAKEPNVPLQVGNLIILSAQQVIIGIAFGFALYLLFQVVSSAGSFISTQMGLNLGEIINPQGSNGEALGSSVPQLYAVIGGLIFLATNSHHLVILAMQQSFEVMPVIKPNLTPELFLHLSQLGTQFFMFLAGMILPITGTLFLTDLLLGILGKAIPQLNLILLQISFKMGVGIVAIIVVLPLTIIYIGQMFHAISGDPLLTGL